MTGPGKYDDICTIAREAAQARGAVLMIFEGRLGSGFSIQIDSSVNLKRLPNLMRKMADTIEMDLEHAGL